MYAENVILHKLTPFISAEEIILLILAHRSCEDSRTTFWSFGISSLPKPRVQLFMMITYFPRLLAGWLLFQGLCAKIKCNHYSHQTFSHKLRPLRHTATLAALQIVRSIIKVVIVLRKEQIIAQRQIDTEELKSSKKAKVKELKDKLEDLHVKVNNLDELLNDVFAG